MEKLHCSDDWANLRREYLNAGQAAPLLIGLTEGVGALAIEAYESALRPAFPQGLAVLAVGGFGRRELFPYSDVDIVVLIDRESQLSQLKEPLAQFVRLLWDADLRLSHSVRTIAECADLHETNVELNISLLDRRLLCGDGEVSARLDARWPAFLERHAKTLTGRLCELARERHAKFQQTIHHLEPDIKETPGGFRDLHLIGWLAKVGLPRAGANERLAAPAAFMHSLRCYLHYEAERDRNTLSFDSQEHIVQEKFTAIKNKPAWMREYFKNARTIFSEARRAIDLSVKNETSLLAQFRDWRSRLSNSEFTVSRERIFLRVPAQLATGPAMFFRLFEFVARHGIPLAAETEQRLEEHRAAFEAYCAGVEPRWPEFEAVLRQPHVALALRAMHNTGLLVALFPEWKDIECLVVPDFYHRYTVDEHTLVAVEQMARLRVAQDEQRRMLAELLSEISEIPVVVLAILFHDSGKGGGIVEHSQRSVELARQCMQRLGVPEAKQRDVEFLIEHHPDMSSIMSSRDLKDPATARMVADRIGTIERLKMLTIVTYADVSAVNPGAMTPWRLEQLGRTYRMAHHELIRELEVDRIQDVPGELPEQASFIRGFPVRYLRTHSRAEIEAHIQLRERSRPTGVAVQLEKHGAVYQVTVVARDMRSLFGSLAGAISSFGLDIVKAEAFANAKGAILDTFVFADPKRTLELNPPEVERLQDTLQKVALGKLDVAKLMHENTRPRKQRQRTIKTSVQFDAQTCETATLVEIITEDRPGLLYDLATTISASACNIDVVLIDTEGRKAIDVFYVACDRHKLTPELQAALRENLIAIC